MSHILDTYRQNVHSALSEQLRRAQEDLLNGVQFRRSVTGAAYMPAVTCEEIALTAVEKATRIKALKEALEVTEEVYRRLFEKDENDN